MIADTVEIDGLIERSLAEGEPEEHSGKARRWTEEEDEFLRQNLGVLSEPVMAAMLGRSRAAVHLRWERDLGLPAPSKAPGTYTARRVGDLLGVDVHSVCRWIERGWLKARFLPFAGRRVRRITLRDLKRFLIAPTHWMLFRVERVGDPKLRRLVEPAMERWGDEWLTPGQVAAMHGVDHSDVNRFIRAGKLAGVKWGNWWIRRSDAEAVFFLKGAGSGHGLDWSEEGDAFLILARAVGLSYATIDRLAGGTRDSAYRLGWLQRNGRIPLLVGKYGLEDVRSNADGTRLLADWRAHRDRFPTLARALAKFTAGRCLSLVEGECVRGLLWTWAAFFLGRNHRLARSLAVCNRTSRGALNRRVEAGYQALLERGIDPLRCRWTEGRERRGSVGVERLAAGPAHVAMTGGRVARA